VERALLPAAFDFDFAFDRKRGRLPETEEKR
jgi:hypothetical protein